MLDLNNCTQDCFSCIKQYKKKHGLKKGQEFEIRCRGIPLNYVNENLSTVDKQTAEAILDPVKWAAEVLDWHCLDPDGEIWKRKNPDEYHVWKEENPDKDILGYSRYHRPYQASMLRCLHGETNIFMADGTVKQIQDIEVGDKVVTYNEGRKTTQTSYRVLNKWDNGVRDIYKIELNNGDILKVTDNHPILSWFHEGKINELVNKKSFKRTYKSLQDGLSVGDKVYTLNQFGIFGEENNIYTARLLGYIVSDGYVVNSGIKGEKHVVEFRNIRKQYVEEFADLVQGIFGVDRPDIRYHPERIDKNNVHHKEHWSTAVYNRNHILLSTLRKLGCYNKINREISLLNFAFKFNKEALGNFINRCWSGDGCIYSQDDPNLEFKRSYISLSSGNKRYLRLFRLLLKKIGIYTSHIYTDSKKDSITINLVISRIEDIEKFLEFTKPIFGKEEQCRIALEQTKLRYHQNRHGHLKTMSRTMIKRIEYIGQETVWDIEVDKRHNFVAEGIVVHNCTSKRKVFRVGRQSGKTECLVISILYNLFLKPGVPENEGFKIVVIAPYQAQIDLIFTRIKQLIQGSVEAQNSIKRDVKAPIYSIELHNTSVVRGFTAGSKSGGNAESVRGQTAHMLVFDECDYLNTGDMDAAMSIITNYPNATLWMSSTPSGKRERFYSTCLSLRFREFYYPSQVNPMWNKALEADFREALTTIGYQHEILAEFGEQEEGVFQNVYVQAAKADYKYGDLPFYHTWTYSMGVDWNDTANGTTINILGFDPTRNKFVIVDRKVVSREGWTQTAAMMKITELNRIWRPMSIYIDSGHGGTQWEMLRKFGFDSLIDPKKGPSHPDSRLRDIIKKYDFGSKVETRDPFTKQKMNKPAKPFLVESTVRRFEAHDIEFPESDIALENQLLGYIIDRVTQSGVPVYKAGNETAGDHALDALMLSVLAFVLEVSPIGNPKFELGITFSGQFGQKIDPDIHEGDTVVYNKTPQKDAKYQRNRTKPDGSRDKLVPDNLIGKETTLPANNTNYNNQVGLWNWPGFSRDAPRPKVRTLDEAVGEAKRKVGLSPRRGSRPNRKNI